ncbi:MAG: hypothetical protein WBC93_13440 [Sulfitobacter sp.]
MRISLSALLVSTLLLTACGAIRDSRVNPFNWFGGGRSAPVDSSETGEVNPLIPTSTGLFANARKRDAIYLGTPIDSVTGLVIERVPGGAIIRVSGVAQRQGTYSVQLTPENEEELPVDGVLTYRLEGIPISGQQGPVQTREITAARSVTDQQLAGVRQIRVEGARNAQVARR